MTSYALDRLQSDTDDDTASMASLASPEDLSDEMIRRLLDQLAEKEIQEDVFALETWRLVSLLDLDDSDLGWDEKVTRLEELGLEFDYPPDMRLCTRYGPSQQSIDTGAASPDDLSTDPLDAMRQVITSLKRRRGVA